MTAVLPEAVRSAGTPIEVWFQDEARVGQQGTLTDVWAERGSRPRALKDLRREWAYLFGAVCAERGIGAALVLPRANTHAMNLHLAEISCSVAPGAHAVLVCDGAGWHRTGGRLRVPGNISLLRLPPRAEPSRERLGILARQQAQQQRIRYLRHHRGPLLRRLELAHEHPRPHSIHRNPVMG